MNTFYMIHLMNCRDAKLLFEAKRFVKTVQISSTFGS